MEHEQDVEVKIISYEMVKPSLLPPSNPTTFTLSFLDQVFYTFHAPLLLYYTANYPTPQGGVDISALKTSLSQTLDQFLPLAGRLLDESTISCNHEGIPFVEAKVNCDLSIALTSPNKLNLLTKFLPPPELQASGLQLISELVPLAFQINVFLCGGVVIGCYMLHKLLDAASIGTFFKYWSALTSKQLNNLPLPNFEATVNAFPPLPKGEHISSLNLNSDLSSTQSKSITSIKSFAFDSIAISKLKARATSEQVPKPTAFEAVTGFVWEQTLATKHNLGLQFEHTTLSIAVNMRPRMSPPLPRESMGNIIIMAHVLVPKESRNNIKFQGLSKEIHSSLSTTYQKINNGIFQGENAKDEFQRSMAPINDAAFPVTSWCKMGLNEADFGFGKPIWIVPTDGKQAPLATRSILCLTDYCHPITGDGIEAWLALEEKEMENIESNPNFQAFASPN